MTPRFSGFAIRGLFSVWLSRAMEHLAAEINAEFPGTMWVSDHGTRPFNFGNVPWLTQQCAAIHAAGTKIVLIGHSFGATSAIMVTQNLCTLNVPVELLCPIDPAAQCTTTITPNARRVIGFYQKTPGQLGQGIDAEGKGWSDADWRARTLDYRRDDSHLGIADEPFVHHTILRELRSRFGQFAGASGPVG